MPKKRSRADGMSEGVKSPYKQEMGLAKMEVIVQAIEDLAKEFRSGTRTNVKRMAGKRGEFSGIFAVAGRGSRLQASNAGLVLGNRLPESLVVELILVMGFFQRDELLDDRGQLVAMTHQYAQQ